MTLRSRDLVDAADAGIDPARLDVFLRRARLEVESGPLPSAQVAVASAGRLVAFETYGDATPESRYILQSVGRTVVAGVVWKLLGEGVLDLDERVAAVIPEFATNGKEVVTLRQVLTHTAGFPFAPLGYPQMLHRADRLAAMAKWRLTYEPGTQLQFHLTSAAWVIAELVERRTGLSFADYLRAEIVTPLGLGFVLPVPADRYDELVTEPIAIDRTSDDQQVDPWGPWYLANADVLAGGEPSHSIAGTAADVALFFQALHHSGLWRRRSGRRGNPHPCLDATRRRPALRRQRTADEHGAVRDRERRGQRQLDASHRICGHLRQWRGPVPARLHGSRDRRLVRLSHQRLSDVRL